MGKVKHDATEFIPTPDKQRTSKSGWCNDGNCDGCRKFFSSGICACTCDHKGQKQWAGYDKWMNSQI